ncbi:hypothetical protein [Croceicoccus naphthovorans]|uniref:Uncharacterized protein n=1 Tax=Croceicoccus naphthovorans TaxID=1348774 RepID=A0A0G3XK46_9SPHN|nr:hypothetical protein [Croceicoccus naphthovorans]AKM10753.1 hypothetical protein AB433_13510 [Croceicoccus naphthovorans]MBB3988942.1 hypothetical protein [Croceicoccus naphthovorans]
MEKDEFSEALGIGPESDMGVHHREKNSFRGISTRKKLRFLTASAVNQDFFDEICELDQLEELRLEWPVTAETIEGLARLKNLKKLRLDSPRNITDFTPLTRMPRLTHLDIENAKHLYDLRWIRPLKDRLVKLNLDGSINTTQKLESLDPLDGFAFEELWLVTTTVKDKDLSPLITCRNLKKLRCAKSVSTFEGFMALADARPDIACDWFSPEHWPGRKWRR